MLVGMVDYIRKFSYIQSWALERPETEAVRLIHYRQTTPEIPPLIPPEYRPLKCQRGGRQKPR